MYQQAANYKHQIKSSHGLVLWTVTLFEIYDNLRTLVLEQWYIQCNKLSIIYIASCYLYSYINSKRSADEADILE